MLKIVVFSFIIFTHCLSIFSQVKHEIRASWITTIGGLDWPQVKANSPYSIKSQKEELCRQLDMLKNANFNTVLFQTRLRGDVIYPSIFETYAESLTGHTGKNPGYDVLKFAIEECHKRGMELHAWIVCVPIGNKRQVNLLGKNSVVKKNPEICKYFNGNWYLDPGNPGSARYLSNMVKEIVTNYDIDGIHLDYIRYPENGKDFPDNATFKKYGKGQDLSQWRRDNITNIVRKIYSDVKLLKPWVKVSSSPIGKYSDTSRYSSNGWNAYYAVYQDVQLWLKNGIQDIIFPMMYFKDNQFYPFVLDWQENKHGRWVVPGLGIYFLEERKMEWSQNEILRQIYFTRKHGLDGQAYFRNRFLTDNKSRLMENIHERFYKYPSVIPPMKWQDSIAPVSVSKGEYIFSPEYIILKWDTEGIKKAGGIYYRIYASSSYPVDTERAENIVCTRTDGNMFVCTEGNPYFNKLYWTVCTVDRYGNESTPFEFNKPEKDDVQLLVNRMPDIPAGGHIIIEDGTGRELFKLSENDKLPQMKKGLYIIHAVYPDGSMQHFSVIIKRGFMNVSF